MRRRAAPMLGLLLAGIAAIGTARAAEKLVLVSGIRGVHSRVELLPLRKAFVGFTATVDGRQLRAIRNDSDPTLREPFLQHVVAMSANAYDKRVLGLVVHQGRPIVPSYTDEARLVRALNGDPESVSYMWQKDAERLPDVKIVRVLWHD